MSGQSPGASVPDEYARFIILSAARTGSNMLASSLNTSPSITCFREIFNILGRSIDFNVEGYDRHDASDRALRDSDFDTFLRTRIFCAHPPQVRAVGFKMTYHHFFGFDGLREWLIEQRAVRVIHLRRHNLLRSLVSEKIAMMTQAWLEAETGSLASKLRPSTLLRAARHPLRYAARLRAALRPREPPSKARSSSVAIPPEECIAYFRNIQWQAARYDELFQEHPKLTVHYEDLLQRREATFNQVQSFLSIDPTTLGIATRRQNPEPLHELLANYDELHAAFEGTPYAAFFD
jgi:hypothetical protein